MKYVMVDHIFPIVFTEAHQHRTFERMNVTSAGFCKIVEDYDERMDGEMRWEGNYVIAYGESLGLKMKPAPQDSKILTRFMLKNA